MLAQALAQSLASYEREREQRSPPPRRAEPAHISALRKYEARPAKSGETECILCLDGMHATVGLPDCGHIVFCDPCAVQYWERTYQENYECPVCRTPIVTAPLHLWEARVKP